MSNNSLVILNCPIKSHWLYRAILKLNLKSSFSVTGTQQSHMHRPSYARYRQFPSLRKLNRRWMALSQYSTKLALRML